MEYWMFHGNPERWRFFDYIAQYGEDSLRDFSWSCHRYKELVRPGHKAVLWMAGPPSTRGVYALGVITSKPYEHTSEEEFWTDPADRHRRMWSVDITFDRLFLKEPILARDLRADPRFADATIIRAPRHANPHRLTRRQWQAILSQASG